MSTHSNRTFIPICPFVKKLLEIIDDPINFDLESERKFVRWSDDGESIVIEVQNFKKWILPQYFHHSSITSFVRQLNAHGFKKISKIKTVEFKEPKQSRSKYHDKYIHFRPEVFVKTKKPNDKSSNSVSKTEVSSNKSGQPEVMVYCHQHFVKKFPENFDKIQRENSKNQFKLLMDSNPIAKTQIPSAVVQANNPSKNTSITSTRKYHNKYIHFRVTDELNNLKSGNQLLKTSISIETSEQERLYSEQTLIQSALESTDTYIKQFYSLFSSLIIDDPDAPTVGGVLDRVVYLKTLLEWELDDGKWLEDFEKS